MSNENSNVQNFSSGGGGVRLQSITITTQPSKRAYYAGETFNTAGMVVLATYSNGATKQCTGYAVNPNGPLEAGTTQVEVVYTEGGISKSAIQTITVTKRQVAPPTQSGTLTYDGTTQSPTWSGTDYMSITGTTSAINAGTYHPTAALNDPELTEWTDGTTEDKTLSWSIGKAEGSVSASPSSVTINTDSTSAEVTVNRAGDGEITASSSDESICTASVNGNVVTVSGSGGKSGTATVTINVGEGTNHTAASASVGVTAQFLPYHAEGLEAYTPEEIKQICDAGKASEYWNVGDMHSIALNGTVGTLALSNFATYVYIQEFTEDGHIRWGCFKDSTGKLLALVDSSYNSYKENGTKAFNMNHWGNYNYGGWKGCDLRYDILGSTKTAPSGYGSAVTSGRVGYDAPADTATSPVANTLMAAFPAAWRAIMRPITWYTDNVGGGNDVASQVTAVVDYLPLMAEFQTNGARSYANSAEQNYQHQLAYFAAGNTKVHYQHSNTGTAAYVWCAGPRYSDAAGFCLLTTGGSANNSNAGNSYALAPGFET